MLPRPRKNKLIAASIICVAIIAVALVWCAPRIEFELLRLRTKASFVVVSDNGAKTASTLDEKQTRHALNVIEYQTQTTMSRRAVIFHDYVLVFCKGNQSACLRKIWVHPLLEPESRDVIDELGRIAVRGVLEDISMKDGLCEGTSTMERLY